MNKHLYSLRMHAERGRAHLSGAERLAGAEDLERLAGELVGRALGHPRGRAERIRLSIDLIPEEAIVTGRLLDLRTQPVDDYRQGREAARRRLLEVGISPRAADSAVAWIARGAAPGGRGMRGAMIIDAQTGVRLEKDPARGVRVSRMDLTAAAERELRRQLAACGLDNAHVREALVLASKVLSAPQIIAELCWSDDPDYPSGYITSRKHGYLRFTHLKPKGDDHGGRAFFVHSGNLNYDTLFEFLEGSVLLFDRIGAIDDLGNLRD